MRHITIEILVKDADDGELLHKITSYSVDRAIEDLGAYERHHMVGGKAVYHG